MGSINTGRVVLGGVLAGAIIILAEMLFFGMFLVSMQQVADNHNFNFVGGGGVQAIILLAYVFGVSICAIWVYALARPRLGPGPKTALIVFLPLWFIGRAFDVLLIAYGVGPANPTIIHIFWTLVTGAIAMLAGAYAYQEE